MGQVAKNGLKMDQVEKNWTENGKIMEMGQVENNWTENG